jgi:hypothetical protein
MRTMGEPEPSSVYGSPYGHSHRHHRYDEEDSHGGGVSSFKRMQKLYKKLDSQMTTITRLMFIMIALEIFRYMKY